jgi:hypothetical protein
MPISIAGTKMSVPFASNESEVKAPEAPVRGSASPGTLRSGPLSFNEKPDRGGR